ncbi:MAG TPA: 50S ribosomal protein L9 [Mycobacteriales bacterium]|jgi:large subunit ribosomal protein L9|nr:50S ribosomal protein L9 [Mycobacteriales bacterium]
MKLILTQEVAGLGAPGEIVEVADGYGRNYLVPQGLAIGWTKGGEKQIVTIQRSREVRQVRDLGHAQEIAAQLAALTVTLKTRAGQGGKLFGSVTPSDVVDAVKDAGGPLLDRRKVALTGHIKAVGTHTVHVDLHPDVQASFPLEVVSA